LAARRNPIPVRRGRSAGWLGSKVPSASARIPMVVVHNHLNHACPGKTKVEGKVSKHRFFITECNNVSRRFCKIASFIYCTVYGMFYENFTKTFFSSSVCGPNAGCNYDAVRTVYSIQLKTF
jgi:hypothetical protein